MSILWPEFRKEPFGRLSADGCLWSSMRFAEDTTRETATRVRIPRRVFRMVTTSGPGHSLPGKVHPDRAQCRTGINPAESTIAPCPYRLIYVMQQSSTPLS